MKSNWNNKKAALLKFVEGIYSHSKVTHLISTYIKLMHTRSEDDNVAEYGWQDGRPHKSLA